MKVRKFARLYNKFVTQAFLSKESDAIAIFRRIYFLLTN